MIVGSYKAQVAVPLNRDIALILLNQHYLGKDHCNKYDGETIVADYDTDSELGKALEKSHRQVNLSHIVDVTVYVHHNGRLTLEQKDEI